MDLVHCFNYKQPIEEINSMEKLVEDFGYVSAEEKILSMINAGIRLQNARDDLYDLTEEEDESTDWNRLEDPTRSPGYDLADASHGLCRASNSIDEINKVLDSPKKAEA